VYYQIRRTAFGDVYIGAGVNVLALRLDLMPHSTTGTTSYVLIKYSRSYPTKRVAQNALSESQNGTEFASEWQHFTNPTIRLILDIKTMPNGETESVRLRILWQMNSGQESGYNQQDVVFASLFPYP